MERLRRWRDWLQRTLWMGFFILLALVMGG